MAAHDDVVAELAHALRAERDARADVGRARRAAQAAVRLQVAALRKLKGLGVASTKAAQLALRALGEVPTLADRRRVAATLRKRASLDGADPVRHGDLPCAARPTHLRSVGVDPRGRDERGPRTEEHNVKITKRTTTTVEEFAPEPVDVTDELADAESNDEDESDIEGTDDEDDGDIDDEDDEPDAEANKPHRKR